jgi:glutamate formiminotransferase
MRQLVECVPNVSEGRDSAVIDQLVSAVRNVPAVALLDLHSDASHNRSVLTFVGTPDAVREAAVRLAGEAARLIDMNIQRGAHPRIGATDVIPFVPVSGVTMYDCVQIAHQTGQEIFRRFSVPIYFYEEAALRPECRALENIRRGQYELLREAVKTDILRRPDIGGPFLHPTAGATVVGARKFLIAFNVNLNSLDVTLAQAIARRIRASGGGVPSLKAIGVLLNPGTAEARAQVAMNLIDFDQTSIPTAYGAVEREAQQLGISLHSSELVGLAPEAAFAGCTVEQVGLPPAASDQIFERRLATHLK